MHLEEHVTQLIYQHDIRTQADLAAHLAARGIEVNQSTLSRRLKKMGVEKVDGVYAMVSSAADGDPIWRVTEVPPNLVVIRTPPSFAQPTAYRIDAQCIAGVVGTVGGDDTILVAHCASDVARLIEDLEKIVSEARIL